MFRGKSSLNEGEGPWLHFVALNFDDRQNMMNGMPMFLPPSKLSMQPNDALVIIFAESPEDMKEQMNAGKESSKLIFTLEKTDGN